MKKGQAHTYQDLDVWKRSMDLVEKAYGIAGSLPKYEQFGLADQIRRASVSIPSNIAEGQKRFGNKETIQFCSIALGSIAELETQLLLCSRLFSIATEDALNDCAIVARMLHALIRSLRSK